MCRNLSRGWFGDDREAGTEVSTEVRAENSTTYSLKIPSPLLASCTNKLVTSHASFPSRIISGPLTIQVSA